jgi:hypothetical protein
MPSVAMPRHGDPRVDAATKARYKAFFENHVTGLRPHGVE